MKLFTFSASKSDDYPSYYLDAECYHMFDDGNFALCASGMEEIFGVPQKSTKVWITVYTRAAKDRFEVGLTSEGYRSYLCPLTVDGKHISDITTPIEVDEKLKEILDKYGRAYIKVEYV